MAKELGEATVTQPLSLIIPIASGSKLEFKQRSKIAEEYGVEIASVLKPIGKEVIRETGTEITPGSLLEVNGSQDAVLKLYLAAQNDDNDDKNTKTHPPHPPQYEQV